MPDGEGLLCLFIEGLLDYLGDSECLEGNGLNGGFIKGGGISF